MKKQLNKYDKRLLLLADYLEYQVPQSQFDMTYYRSERNRFGNLVAIQLGYHINNCTSKSMGSAMGWSPFVEGLEVEVIDEFLSFDGGSDSYFDWNRYAIAAFHMSDNTHEYRWCFDPAWVDKDNTPVGASNRIREFVHNGLPEDWFMQLRGATDYLFKNRRRIG